MTTTAERESEPDNDFVAGIIQQVREEEEELARLRQFFNEVSAAIANDGPHSIEHLLATARLSKETTVIGRSRLDRLQKLLLAAEHYIRCTKDPLLSPYIKEDGRLGDSPWAEFCEAVRFAR